jgi:hypothetical protein
LNNPLNLARNNHGPCSFKGTVLPLASVFHWYIIVIHIFI